MTRASSPVDINCAIIFGGLERDHIAAMFNLAFVVKLDEFQVFLGAFDAGSTEPNQRRAIVADILKLAEPFRSAFIANGLINPFLLPPNWTICSEYDQEFLRFIQKGYAHIGS